MSYFRLYIAVHSMIRTSSTTHLAYFIPQYKYYPSRCERYKSPFDRIAERLI